MPHKIILGTHYDLEISARRAAVVGFAAIWLGLAAVGWFVLQLSPFESIAGGLVCAILHELSELLHQLGHAGAARRTGYPMRGVCFVHVLALSLYPRDEPALSGKIHIRRALGGPAVSLVLSILGLLVLLVAQNVGGIWYWIALWFFLENLLVFFLGAFLPLGFTDGSTILEWWGKP